MKKIKYFNMVVIFCFALLLGGTKTECKKITYRSTYVVYPKSKKSSSDAINSCLRKLEKQGGGTLRFKKGKYYITNALYVPSNVTILFDSGVVIVKKKTSVASIFKCISPSKKSKKRVVGGYGGTHDVTFAGRGNVVFRLKESGKKQKSLGIVLAHCKNIKIKHIQFTNMSEEGHFIELNSSKNVEITDCSFDGKIKKASNIKEAINIDSADAKTGGLSTKDTAWSKFDQTCCRDILIKKCRFSNVASGIGTHKISATKDGKFLYHKNIVIENNEFTKVGRSKNNSTSPVRMMNWKDAIIRRNRFTDCKNRCGIRCRGVDNPVIYGNTFEKCDFKEGMLWFYAAYNNGKGSQYGSNNCKNVKHELVKNNICMNTIDNIKGLDGYE